MKPLAQMSKEEREDLLKLNNKYLQIMRKTICKVLSFDEKNCGSICCALYTFFDVCLTDIILNPGELKCWIGASYDLERKTLGVSIDFYPKMKSLERIKTFVDKFNREKTDLVFEATISKDNDNLQQLRLSAIYESIEISDIQPKLSKCIKQLINSNDDEMFDAFLINVSKSIKENQTNEE